MEEFLFWLTLILRLLKHLFPFIIGAFAAILAFKLVGKPPVPYLIPVALFITLMIGVQLKILFTEFFK